MGGLKKILCLALAVVAACGIFLFVGGQEKFKKMPEMMIKYIEAQGDNAVLVYMFFTFVGVVALIPTTPMEFAGGFLFTPRYGMWTTLFFTSFAKFFANLMSIFLAKNVFKDWIFKNFVNKSELLTMASTAVREEPYKMAFLVRGSMVPLSVKNYGLGVLDIGYVPLMAAGLIFSPLYALQNIYFGSACQDLTEVLSLKKAAGPQSWMMRLKSVAPIIFNVLLIIVLIRAMKTQISKQKDKMKADLKAKTEGKTD